MKINISAGHAPDGKVACGAVGLIKESTEARKVKNEVIKQLKKAGHTVYDCTCESGNSASDVLRKIVLMCNAHTVDLDVSIHFNAGANDKTGNGKTTGTEVYIQKETSKAKPYAEKICKAIAGLGFKDRGVKTRTNLYFLNHTNAPSLLVECCFVDDKDDVKLYDYEKMASAIVAGITGVKAGCPYDKPTKSVKPTSSKNDIKWLQYKLNEKNKAGLDVDGGYGKLTQNAVLAYWKKLGWNKENKDDGLTAGAKTIAKLSE